MGKGLGVIFLILGLVSTYFGVTTPDLITMEFPGSKYALIVIGLILILFGIGMTFFPAPKPPYYR